MLTPPKRVQLKYGRLTNAPDRASIRYCAHAGKKGDTWYVPQGHNTGGHVIYENPNNREGFGGRPVTLTLVDGTQVQVVGPWLSNTNALYEDTGVDIRHTHPVAYVVALGVEYAKGGTGSLTSDTFVDVLECNLEGHVGAFNYSRTRAQHWADKLNRQVVLGTMSEGGSSRCRVDPIDYVELVRKELNGEATLQPSRRLRHG